MWRPKNFFLDSLPRSEESDPVTLLQRGFDENDPLGLEGLQSALRDIIRDKLWSSRGDFASFAHFAVAAKPAGLGLHTVKAAQILKDLLIGLDYYAEWGLVLDLIRRPAGNPTFVKSEGCRRFYKISTASMSVDRMLCELFRHHPEVFARLQAREVTYREATRSIRQSRTETARRFSAKLSEDERRQLMSDLFERMPASAQRAFVLANLDVVPDANIAAALKNRQAANSGA